MKKRPPTEVLIVEDEPLTRIVAADAISDSGLPIREAGDAKEALKILKHNSDIGILFTDIDMPGPMNGLGLAEQVHVNHPEVELIVTSGATTLQDSDLPDSGTFLPKPYRMTRLLEVVKHKLANHERRQSD